MRPRPWHHLDELFAGQCDGTTTTIIIKSSSSSSSSSSLSFLILGMTYEEIEQQFPDEWERRSTDKLAYRYPRGESYLDVIARLEPIIIEMERHRESLLIIGHQVLLLPSPLLPTPPLL